MAQDTLGARWRAGWNSVLVWLLTSLVLLLVMGLGTRVFGAHPVLRVVGGLALFAAVAPLVAGAVTRTIFPNARPAETLRTRTVATFTDEPSAHAAAAALERAGIHAAVESGGISSQAGFPLPVADVRVIVAEAHAVQALDVLERTRREAARDAAPET